MRLAVTAALLLVVSGGACGKPGAGERDAPSTPGDDADPGDRDAPTTGVDGSLSCPVDTWCLETSPVAGVRLEGVYAVDAGDVFAVGAGGVILRRRADVWTQMTSNTTADLKGVWGANSSDVWAVGVAGTLLHWDGSAWTPQTGVTTRDLEAAWGSSATDVWIAATGAVLHFDGQSWSTQNLTGSLFAISGTGPNDVWATGENARVHHYNGAWDVGGSINPYGTGGTNNFFAVLALAPDNVWVSAAVIGKETMNFTGGAGAWTPHGTSVTIFAGLWGTAANNLWGAGQSGKVGHHDGSAWSIEVPLGVTSALRAVTGAGSHVWIVGGDATILHRD
ncbi:MAG: hypothetical protein KF773_29475 [Deltaproteobacteria bacterium]|nr:hypothetical protein [Deltaproteobacteria bacterium]